MARTKGVILPGNDTLRILYAALIIFGMNMTIMVLRMVATGPTRSARVYYDDDDANVYDVNMTSAGCDFIGNGSEEIGGKYKRCKRKMLKMVLDADSDGLLQCSSFEEEYDVAVIGTPLQPIHQCQNPCWISSQGQGHTKQSAEGHFRCLPYFLVVGSSRETIISCQRFSDYLDMFSPASARIGAAYQDQVRESSRRRPEGRWVVPGVTYDVTSLYPGIWQRNHYTNRPYYSLYPVSRLVLASLKVVLVLQHPIERMLTEFRVQHSTLSVEDFRQAFDTVARKLVAEWRDCVHDNQDTECIRRTAYNDQHRGRHHGMLLRSLYSVLARDWLKQHSSSRVHVVVFESLELDLSSTLPQLYDFLQLKHTRSNNFKDLTNSTSKELRESNLISWKTKAMLEYFFKPYNNEIATMLNNTKLTSW